MNGAPNPAGKLLYATTGNRASLSRQAKAGRIMQVGRGIYLSGASLPVPDAIGKHRFELAARYWPDAVICDRSAFTGGELVDGLLFVCHPEPGRKADLVLPGLTVSARVGAGPLPGDMPFLEGLHLSGTVRSLVENLPTPGRPVVGRPARPAGREAVESRIDSEAQSGGTGRLAALLAELDVIRPSLPSAPAETVRELLAALLGTYRGKGPRHARLKARMAGAPFDQRRIVLFSRFRDLLLDTAPTPRNSEGDRWEWLPFFEAYFSNFIEGTKFDVKEAVRIAIDGEVSPARPADAHDVQATYRIAVDPMMRAHASRSGEEFLEQLRDVHRVLMAARPDMRPGLFKDVDNYFGAYKFVEPDLLEGTLMRGFDTFAPVTDAFQRAAALMLVITECHPFYDGNGRTARLISNAALSAAGQVRIVIPSIYRNDYLRGLRGVSNANGQGQALLAVLGFAQRWTTVIDWRTFDGADAMLRRTHAYDDPAVVGEDVKLRMP